MPRLSTDAPKPGCPNCGHELSHVLEVEGRVRLKTIRRRRLCRNCGCRWSTEERIDPSSVTIPIKVEHPA